MLNSKNMLPGLILWMSVLISAYTAPSDRLVIQSAHEGRVLDMQWHRRTRSLLSLGEDGFLIVSNVMTKQVIHRFRVSNGRVIQFQMNPSDNKVAILDFMNNKYTISVWDWSKEDKMFKHTMESEPLFLTWSTRGSYLAVGRFDSPSVILLDEITGAVIPYLKRVPTLYNAGYIGSTENILMAYSSSGTIDYRDIKTSLVKFSTETTSGLEEITILQTGKKSSMLARKGRTLYLINRQTGEVLDKRDVPGLHDLDIDPDTGIVRALAYTPFSAGVISLMIDGDVIAESEEMLSIPIEPTLEPGAIAGIGKKICIAIETGALLLADDGKFSTVIEAQTWNPDSLAFHESNLYLGGLGQILRVTSPFFSQRHSLDMIQLGIYRTDLQTVAPKSGKIGMKILPNGQLLVWNKDFRQTQSAVQVLEFDNPDNAMHIQTASSVNQISLTDDGHVLAIDQSGTISLYSLKSGERTTSYSALGLSAAAISPTGDFILTGRTIDNVNTTPLEVINVHTGESLPITDDRFMVFDIVADSRSFYSIGIARQSEDADVTKILVHNGSNPRRSQLLVQESGADTNAAVIPQSSGSGIYVIVNGKVKLRLRSRNIAFIWNSPISDIMEWNGILYGIDSDGMLVLWNAVKGGSALLQVQLFRDGAWIARIPESLDNIWLSPNARNKISLFRFGRSVDWSKNKTFQIMYKAGKLEIEDKKNQFENYFQMD